MDDLISRQSAIEALGEEPDIAQDTEEEWAERDTWARHIRAIESLPTATPTERTGEEKKIQTIKVEPSESFHNKIRWMRIKTRILKRKAKEREDFLRRMKR